MNYTILLLEDEKNLGLSLSEFLSDEYGTCLWAKTVKEALNYAHEYSIDLCLSDIGLPDGDGLDFIKQLKQFSAKTKFLFFSALNDPETKVKALELGGLDYITKPFALKELNLRLRRILSNPSKSYQFGKLLFDLNSYEIKYGDGHCETLNQKEYKILELFINKAEQVLSRDEIIANVWGEDQFPSNRTVDNYIVNLRKWCSSDPSEPIEIQSIRGVGYRFTEKK